MEIYLRGTRMFMIMEVNESFSFEAKAGLIKAIRRCRSGKISCGSFKQPLPDAQGREKNGCRWKEVFKLEELESPSSFFGEPTRETG